MAEENNPETGAAPIARVMEVWKSYGGIPVLKGVNLSLRPGEIHALVGGNGAGKSTLMKVLTGVVTPDSGTVEINGRELRHLSPRSAHENGIYMVPQEPQLFPSLSVRENIGLCLEGLSVPGSQIEELAHQTAPQIDLDDTAGQLSISDQQLVEIIRGILRGAAVLIVDEPTASLTVWEVDRLFGHLRALAAQGVGIFYITHRLNEISELCDRVGVLRDGSLVSDRPVGKTSVDAIVSEMIPDSVREAAATENAEAAPTTPAGSANNTEGNVVLSVRGLTGQGFRNISLHVRAGEIVGLAGVVGAGRTELAETIFGVRPGEGAVEVAGRRYDRRSPSSSIRRGLSYVPEDRHANGVFLLGSIVENTTSGILSSLSRRGFLQARRERDLVETLTQQLDLQRGGLGRRVGSLSGGNQQKVSLSKALANRPQVVILDEPSRGVDVSARADLYRMIKGLSAAGTAILVISSDFEEICEIADRVLVMRDGTVKDELCGSDIQLANVRDRCFGISRKAS